MYITYIFLFGFLGDKEQLQCSISRLLKEMFLHAIHLHNIHSLIQSIWLRTRLQDYYYYYYFFYIHMKTLN